MQDSNRNSDIMREKVPKKVHTVRLDQELVRRANALGYTLTEAVEMALRDWLTRKEGPADGGRKG